MSNIADKKEYESLVSGLGELGIKEKEARVYITLLTRNEVGASKIIQATGLHRQFIYDALDGLESKGLVHHAVIRGRKKWSANAPSKIKILIEQKKLLAENIAERLGKLGNKEHAQDFEIYQGREASVAHDFDIMENANDGDFMDIIAGDSITYYRDVLGKELTGDFEKILKSKNIYFRIICPEEQKGLMIENRKKYTNFEFRIVPKMKVGLVNTVIRPKSITFHTYSTPLLSYTVNSSELALTYKQFFDSLWDMCDEA